MWRNIFKCQEPLDEPENIEESNQQEKNCSTSKKCESNITPICAKRISPNLFQINYKKFHQKRSEITKKLFEKTKQSDFMYNKTQEASFLDNETDIDDQIFLHGNKKVVTSSEKEQNNEKSQQDTGANTFNVPSNENVRQNCDEITRLKEIEYLSKINADSKSQLDSLYLEDHEMIECKDDSFSSGLFDKDKDFLDLENESNISESYHFPYNKYYTKNHEGRQLEKLHGYGNEKEYKSCNT
ncbi:uncharacterized protein LOC129614002 [Condylostylus longicornis]|uniref:uncharacterized protein LOC129614002 n=1 Tax=Condylostylus longicornis TaxID=2530218 RepID=UPI00244E3E84|nr:uncharacterized protein LOC129614002 [Condylostylus longicornis]